jgi:hypothetical protein
LGSGSWELLAGGEVGTERSTPARFEVLSVGDAAREADQDQAEGEELHFRNSRVDWIDLAKWRLQERQVSRAKNIRNRTRMLLTLGFIWG